MVSPKFHSLPSFSGNPKERDTHLCLRFFQNNLVNPKIALTNLLKYMTPKIITKPPKVCDTHIK